MNETKETPLSERLKAILASQPEGPFGAPRATLIQFMEAHGDAIVKALEKAERFWLCECGEWNDASTNYANCAGCNEARSEREYKP